MQKHCVIEDHNLPYFSRNRRAFSRKDGPPSISSSASRIGLPTTKDLTGRLFPASRRRNIVKITMTGSFQSKMKKLQ